MSTITKSDLQTLLSDLDDLDTVKNQLFNFIRDIHLSYSQAVEFVDLVKPIISGMRRDVKYDAQIEIDDAKQMAEDTECKLDEALGSLDSIYTIADDLIDQFDDDDNIPSEMMAGIRKVKDKADDIIWGC